MNEAAGDLEQRVGLLLRGVQRMADNLGALEQRLPDLARKTELEHVSDVVTALTRAVDVLLREQSALLEAVRQPVGLDRLTDAVRALRDDLAEMYERQQRSMPQVEVDLSPLVGELQSLRADVGRLRAQRLADAAPPPPAVAPPPPVDLSGVESRLAAIEAHLDREPDPAPVQPPPPPAPTDRAVLERLRAIEDALAELAHRDDVRRGVERVVGEVKAVDERLGALADDVRIVRQLRDGLAALEEGVGGVRQLTSRTASAQQMADLSRELGAVLGEIAAARNQVLRVEQQATPIHADVVAVSKEVDDLGHKIDQLADAVEAKGAAPQVTERLRTMSEAARQLGNGILEDLRSRRRSNR